MTEDEIKKFIRAEVREQLAGPAHAEPVLTPSHLAEVLGVDETTVMEWRRRYEWPPRPLGRTFRFTPEQAAAIVRQHMQPGRKPTSGLPGQTALSASRHRR